MIEALAFGGQGDLKIVEKMLRMNMDIDYRKNKFMESTIIWEGLHEFVLFLVKCYQLRLFDVIDYERDLCKEQQRLKTVKKRSHYTRDISRKELLPEQSILYVRIV